MNRVWEHSFACGIFDDRFTCTCKEDTTTKGDEMIIANAIAVLPTFSVVGDGLPVTIDSQGDIRVGIGDMAIFLNVDTAETLARDLFRVAEESRVIAEMNEIADEDHSIKA